MIWFSTDCPGVEAGTLVGTLIMLWVYTMFIHLTVQTPAASAGTGILLFFTQTYVLYLDPFGSIISQELQVDNTH